MKVLKLLVIKLRMIWDSLGIHMANISREVSTSLSLAA